MCCVRLAVDDADAAVVAVQLDFFAKNNTLQWNPSSPRNGVVSPVCRMEMVCVSTFENYNIETRTRAAAHTFRHTIIIIHENASHSKKKHIVRDCCLFIWSDYDPCIRFKNTMHIVRIRTHT